MRFRSIKGISKGKKAFLSNFFSNNTRCTWLSLSLSLPLFFFTICIIYLNEFCDKEHNYKTLRLLGGKEHVHIKKVCGIKML